MTPRRRADDMDDSGALARKAKPAWQLIGLIASILVAGGMAVAASRAVATEAAKEVVQPVSRKLDDHLARMEPLQMLMQEYVREQRENNRAVSRKIDALCRAAPSANCPLGGP